MKPTAKKLVLRISVGMLAAGAAFYASQQVGSLLSVQENYSQEQITEQIGLAESLYSRNLQAIDLANAVGTAGAQQNFIDASNSWTSSLTATNLEIKSWLQEKRALSLNQNIFRKDFNIPEGQLRGALGSLDESIVAQAINALIIDSADARNAPGVSSAKLAAAVDAILEADAQMQEVTTLILEGN